MKKTIIVFTLLILAILLLFQIGKYAVVSGDLKTEIVIAAIAILFFFIGIYISKLPRGKPRGIMPFGGANKKSLQKYKAPSAAINYKKIKALEITTREYEVLQGISEGLSNKEIAEKLFLSESTIKTHVSNVLAKLNAKRRTQAVQIAKDYQII